MDFKNEKELEIYCCTWAITNHNLVHVKMEVPGQKGWPDQLFFKGNVRGHRKITMFFVEFKDLGEKPDKLQKLIHKIIRASGIRVHVIDNFEDFKDACHVEIHT